MLDAAKLQRVLPRLSDYGKDVDSWISDFSKTMDLYDIFEPRRIFIWAKEAVEEDIAGKLNSIRNRRNNEIVYPSIREIQVAIEEHLKITDNDKCSVLKSLKIKPEETLKKFNYRYLKLYHKLGRDYQKLISVKDYTNAISSRVFPCSRVITMKCETLTDAFEMAELGEEAEKEILANTIQTNNNYTNNLMFTQGTMNGNLLTSHPFYQSFNVNPINQNYSVNPYMQGTFQPPYNMNQGFNPFEKRPSNLMFSNNYINNANDPMERNNNNYAVLDVNK